MLEMCKKWLNDNKHDDESARDAKCMCIDLNFKMFCVESKPQKRIRVILRAYSTIYIVHNYK